MITAVERWVSEDWGLSGVVWHANLGGWAGQAAIRSNEMLFNSVRSVACSIVMPSTRP
jgi:hypothetical protein